jgi:hypothetical protein
MTQPFVIPLGSDRKPNAKGRPLADFALDHDEAAVFLHNPVDDCEA